MRSVLLALAAIATSALGCKQDAPPDTARKATGQRPQPKKLVDKTPLPPLAPDRGGATGRALWATGFGGLGIDSPRAVAVAPGGDSYVVGYFDGEIDLGPAGKHRAADSGKDPRKPPTDAFVIKLGTDGK